MPLGGRGGVTVRPLRCFTPGCCACGVLCFSPPVAGWVEFYGVVRIGGSGDSRCEEKLLHVKDQGQAYTDHMNDRTA